MNESTLRICAALGGMLAAGAFIGVMSVALAAPSPGEITFGGILLDRSSDIYPFTIQNLMWLLFFVGLGDLLVRFARGGRELGQLRLQLLPEDDETMLRAQDLGEIYSRVRPPPLAEPNFLQRLIGRIVLQFQSSGSVNQANALLNSSFGSALPGWSQCRAREASTQKASPRLMRGLVLAIAALSGL